MVEVSMSPLQRVFAPCDLLGTNSLGLLLASCVSLSLASEFDHVPNTVCQDTHVVQRCKQDFMHNTSFRSTPE